jgi:hypothetical protein
VAVLIEAISVVIQTTAIEAKYPGGWEQFRLEPPNQTLMSDGELVCIGFMEPRSVEAFVAELKEHGLQFDQEAQPSDFCVVDQMDGKGSAAEWLSLVEGPIGSNPVQRVKAAMLVGGSCKSLYTPSGWSYENSLSDKPTFVPSDAADTRLLHLGAEDGLDVYWDNEAQRKVYKPTVTSH